MSNTKPILLIDGHPVGGGVNYSADNVEYDNTASGLSSTNIQDAIDEVNINAANKSDFTSISQTGTTATRAISEDLYFYLNGNIVRAKTTIANGDTFVLNTNYEEIAVGTLNLYKDAIRYHDYLCSFPQGSKGGYYYVISVPSGYCPVSICVDYSSLSKSTATSGISFYLSTEGLGNQTGFIFCNQSVSNVNIRVFYEKNTGIKPI